MKHKTPVDDPRFDPNKVTIFLDIDGVLNCGIDNERLTEELRAVRANEETLTSRQMRELIDWILVSNIHVGDWVAKDKLELFRAFVEKWDAQVIVISAWIQGGGKENSATVRELFEMPQIIDATIYHPDISGSDRGTRVHDFVTKYNVNNYVTLDDSWKEMHDGYWNKCPRISGRCGLTERNLKQADRMLSST